MRKNVAKNKSKNRDDNPDTTPLVVNYVLQFQSTVIFDCEMPYNKLLR